MQETLVQSLGEEGNGYPLHYSCLQNSVDKGAWQAAWGCKEFGRDWMMLLLANPSLHNCLVCNLWSAMCHIPLNHSIVFWLIKRSLSWKLRFLFGISIPHKCFLKTLWIHTSGRISQVENKTKATFLASLFILILNVFGLHSYDK